MSNEGQSAPALHALEALLQLSERATPGEWATGGSSDPLSILATDCWEQVAAVNDDALFYDHINAALIVAAVNFIREHGEALRSLAGGGAGGGCPQPAQVDEWRPIESAPKDGVTLILCCDEHDVYVGCRPIDCPDGAACDMHGIACYPTHWRPLPAIAALTPTAAATEPPPDDPERGKNNPSWPLLDRVEFALRDAGFDYDEAFHIAQLAADSTTEPTGADTEWGEPDVTGGRYVRKGDQWFYARPQAMTAEREGGV